MIIETTAPAIEFAATGNEEILQNVRTITSTIMGTVVCDREFGIDDSMIDAPTEVAKAKIRREYIVKIQKYEPRAKVDSVTFIQTDNLAHLKPKVVFSLA